MVCYNIILRVSDSGIGISSKDIDRIFEPFYTKKVMGRSGTGLGMAVIWGTVKDHNGYIDVKSIKGKWTTFTLYFPVSRQEIAKEKTLLPMEDYMGKGESILVVDDVKVQREIAFTILTTLNYMVDTAASGEEAVVYLKEHAVDLIILDMIMDPGINGRETYEKILKIHPNQKAIILRPLKNAQFCSSSRKAIRLRRINHPDEINHTEFSHNLQKNNLYPDLTISIVVAKIMFRYKDYMQRLGFRANPFGDI